MKIILNHFSQIQTNFAKKPNLRFKNVSSSDVYIKNNVSFGKKRTQSPKEILIKHKGFSESEADIILSIGNINLGNEITSLIENGYDFNSAIDEIIKNNFLPVAEDFKNYQSLSADCELDIIDKISIVSYKIKDEQIERYKKIKSKFTEKYEAILAVKLGLLDEQITQYLSSKNSHTLAPDELMICIKENFDDSQFARFAELKNRKKSFENKTTRKQEEQQFYPIKYIISCIKENKTDEDIEREDKIVNFINEGYSIELSVALSYLKESQYKQFLEYVNNGINTRTAITLAQLTTEQQNRYFEHIKKGGWQVYYAEDIAILSEEQYKNYLNLVQKEEFELIAHKLALLDEQQLDSFKSLMECYNLDAPIALVVVSELTKEEINNYIELCLKNSGSFYDISLIAIAKMSAEEINEYKKLTSETEDFIEKALYMEYVLLSPEQKRRIDKLRNIDGEERCYLPELAKLTTAQFERYKTFVKNGEAKYHAIELAKLSNKQYQKYIEELAKKEDKNLAIWIASGRKKEFEKIMLSLTQNQKESNQSSDTLDIIQNDYEKLSQEQKKRYEELIHYQLPYTALQIAKLTENEYERYKQIPVCLSLQEAIILAKNSKINSLTPELLEKLPEDFWYKINTGCEKEIHEIIEKALIELLLEQRGENNSLNLIPLKNIQFQLEKPGYGENHMYYSKNNEYLLNNKGDFELKTAQPFYVNLSQGLIRQKPILVVKDKISNNQYVSYNGAIAKVKPIQNHCYAQFKPWGNILPQMQVQILAKAANEFAFNLFDKNSNCIIGQNSPKFDIKNAKDKDIEDFYSNKLLELKEKNSLNAQEILKLMPKDCMLTISPYIQDADIRFAIVCEWFSKDKNRWQMEIHSQDSKWNNDEKWTFRLHKQTKLGRQYFQFTNNESEFDFNGTTSEGNAHIKIPTPLEENDLLNNVEFQTIIKQISSKQYENFEIDKISSKLNINGQNNEEKLQNIINHCLKNPLDFARYKDVILKLRTSLGMLELV